MRTPNYFGVLVGFITSLAVALQAQTAAPGDSIVQITAESLGLTPIPPGEALPRFCTVWVIEPGLGGAMPPLPFLPPGTYPLFQLPDGSVLADGTVNQTLPNDATKATAILAAEANAVVNLVNQIQAAAVAQELAEMLGMDLPPSPASGGGDDGDDLTNNYAFYNINTNLLWLQITNVSGGTAYANLMECTNRSGVPGRTNLAVYAIWSTTNLALPFSLWQVETEGVASARMREGSNEFR